MGIYNKIVNDKLEFVNKISDLLNNAIEKKKFENIKDDVLKLIGNGCICDVNRKGCKEDNKEKDSVDSENNNNNNNLIDILLNNEYKIYNLNDKVLNNIIKTAKRNNEILNNSEKISAIFNKIKNIPKNDLRLKLDICKKLNILLDDLINHIWRLIYGKNMKVNNEIDNIDCDKVEDAKIYVSRYINIVNDKLCLMEDLNVDTSNDMTTTKIKDLKSITLKSVNKFNSYVKQDTKKKDTKSIIQYDANNNNNNNNNNKPDIEKATNDDIKAYIIDKQKLIKKKI